MKNNTMMRLANADELLALDGAGYAEGDCVPNPLAEVLKKLGA